MNLREMYTVGCSLHTSQAFLLLAHLSIWQVDAFFFLLLKKQNAKAALLLSVVPDVFFGAFC